MPLFQEVIVALRTKLGPNCQMKDMDVDKDIDIL